MPEQMITPEGRRIAYNIHDGSGPAVVFLGGFRSDMGGTKALWLDEWACTRGRAFVRFDYSGHGLSGGKFEDGCISDWAADAAAILSLVNGKAVLAGSSMGGWIALLLARAFPDRVTGLVTIAAAPDFTEDLMWGRFDSPTRDRLLRDGQIALPSAYGDPDIITSRLIEDGRSQLVLRSPLAFRFPVRMLQGTADSDVPPAVALRLLNHLGGPDVRLTLVKDADHRFSTPACLDLIVQAIDEVSA